MSQQRIRELEHRASSLRRQLATAYACDHDRTIGRLEGQLEYTEQEIARLEAQQRRTRR